MYLLTLPVLCLQLWWHYNINSCYVGKGWEGCWSICGITATLSWIKCKIRISCTKCLSKSQLCCLFLLARYKFDSLNRHYLLFCLQLWWHYNINSWYVGEGREVWWPICRITKTLRWIKCKIRMKLNKVPFKRVSYVCLFTCKK